MQNIRLKNLSFTILYIKQHRMQFCAYSPKFADYGKA